LSEAPAFLRVIPRRAKGYVLITGPDGLTDEGETLQCVHCGMHWRVQPGSGRKRGFCLRCDGPTCGKPACEARCVPFERAIEEMEGRQALDRALYRLRDK